MTIRARRLVFAVPSFAALLLARAAGQDTTLVSVDSAGTGVGNSAAITSHRCVGVEKGHRLVVFRSRADNLVKGDTNGADDVFLRNVDAGVTTRLSVDPKGGDCDFGSSGPIITPDGRFVGFSSFATNLVSGDKNGARDAFLLDRTTGVIERVSLDDSGNEIDDDSIFEAVSDDGDVVAFRSSSENVAPSDSNGVDDLFVRIRSKATTICVSLVPGTKHTGDRFSGSSSLSADGHMVLFSSLATDLVANDTNLNEDLFLYDVGAGTLERVSVNASGLELNDRSTLGCLAADGSSFAFLSEASNLDRDATDGEAHVYWKDLATGDVVLVSRGLDGQSHGSFNVLLGRPLLFDFDDGGGKRPQVAFVSDGTNLFDDGRSDIDHFVVDLQSGIGQCISVDSAGVDLDVNDVVQFAFGATPDGRAIAFSTRCPFDSIDSGTSGDVYLRGLEWVVPTEYGVGLAGRGGFVPHLTGRGGSAEAERTFIALHDGLGGAFGLLWLGFGRTAGVSLFGGTFYVDFAQPFIPIPILLDGAAGVPGAGGLTILGANTEGVGPLDLHLQVMLLDSGAPKEISLSNALELTLGGF